MKSVPLLAILLSLLYLPTSKATCCWEYPYVSGCPNGKSTDEAITACADCTPAQRFPPTLIRVAHCGVGDCNRYGCQCKGGCKQSNGGGVAVLSLESYWQKLGLPKYGIEPSDEAKMAQELQKIDQWGMNILALDEYSAGHPMVAVMVPIFKSRHLFEHFGIHPKKFINLMKAIEAAYHDTVKYHTRRHGADVAQSVHVLLLHSAFKNVFSELEILTVLWAAAIHDLGHVGLTNGHLKATNHSMYLKYKNKDGGASTLEINSLEVAFEMVYSKRCDCNIFERLSEDQRAQVKKMSYEWILATDMVQHNGLAGELKELKPLKKPFGLESMVVRRKILKHMLHVADLSNPAKPTETYKLWYPLITEEFFQQGDIEKGKPDVFPKINMNCDRVRDADVDKGQVGFLGWLSGYWNSWVAIDPDAAEFVANLKANIQYHKEIIQNRVPTTARPAEQAADLSDLDLD